MDDNEEETEGKGAIMFEKERIWKLSDYVLDVRMWDGFVTNTLKGCQNCMLLTFKSLTFISRYNLIFQLDCLAASYVGKDCRLLPPVLAKLYGRQTRRLDLSFNCLVSLGGLEKFEFLEELVLDNNCLSDSIRIPSLLQLHTLSLNKNKITNLELVLSQLSEKLPALSYLSLLGNPACPDQLSDCELDEQDYLTYRIYVLYRVPGLRFLDSRAVDAKERDDARTKGRFMRIVRPSANNPSDEDSEDVTGVYSPLPGPGAGTATGTATGTAAGTGAYGRCRYRYSGKHSEGNRFISNNDL